jgi:predicted ester cyclase
MPSITQLDAPSTTSIALRSIEIMGTGTLDDFHEVVHPEFFNHEQRDEPPATRGTGTEKVYGVAQWLRSAFSDLRWDVHHTVAEDDLVVVRCTMAGSQTGDFVSYDLEGRVADVFAPTGREFAATQSHWLRISDGQAIEHWANRDDMGMGDQLGWSRPTPAYLVRCAIAKSRARRAADPPRYATVRPFGRWDGDFHGVKAAALRAIDAMRATPEEAFWRFGHPTRLLHDSFADLEWTVHNVVAEGDLVAVHLTVSGRQVGPVASYDAEGWVENVFPSKGRSFATMQTHWLRVADGGRIVDHWSDRDDLGMAMQLGWIPPTPAYLVRMALAKRRISKPEGR